MELAERYFSAVESTCRRLANHPLTGSLYKTTASGLTDLRWAPVKGFGKYLIFYRPTSNGIDVLRVLNANRDIEGILVSEERQG